MPQHTATTAQEIPQAPATKPQGSKSHAEIMELFRAQQVARRLRGAAPPEDPYKNRKVRTLSERFTGMVKDKPNFHKSGSIRGMKKLYYGQNALLVRCGSYIYNVSDDPTIYFTYAHD